MAKNRKNQSALTLDQLIECRNKILSNAQSLLEDAKCLKINGRYQRSFTLSHLASEEIAKLAILVDPILRTLYRQPIQWDLFWKKFRSHDAKLLTNAVSDYFMLPLNETFGRSLAEYTDRVRIRNDNKNMSLYVTFKDGKFVEPADVITKETADTEHSEAIKRFKYSVQAELYTEFLVAKFRKDPSSFKSVRQRKMKEL